MSARTSIFDSQSESELFRTLDSRWSPSFGLYPQLPFPKLIEVDDERLTDGERRFYYSTNVDFTLCDKSGRPLLAIEFDGIGGGFSRDGEYVPGRETNDPNRKLKLDFKLRLSRDHDFTLVVISYEETRQLGPGESLAIVDSIIGQILSRKRLDGLLSERVNDALFLIETWPEWARNEYLQDVVMGAEVDAKLEADPIALLASQYAALCADYGVANHRQEFISDPPLPEVKDLFDVEEVKARIAAMQSATRIGCRLVVPTPQATVVQTIWVRNFQGLGVSPYVVAKNIAEYLAFKRVLQLTRGGGME